MPGDGCANCKIEWTWRCSGSPSQCHKIKFCGNSRIEIGEECDDGERKNGDGCNRYCLIEENWECAGQPSVCEKDEEEMSINNPICGNGQKEQGEECDDSNKSPFDGCSASCTEEDGWDCHNTFQNTPSKCVKKNTCGDGKFDPDNGESCDDGNKNNFDGCLENCKIVNGFECHINNEGEKSACRKKCGNGKLESGNNEQCDDGNSRNNDGCE